MPIAAAGPFKMTEHQRYLNSLRKKRCRARKKACLGIGMFEYDDALLKMLTRKGCLSAELADDQPAIDRAVTEYLWRQSEQDRK